MPGLTLFVDGTVLTLDPAAPVAEALAVRDGRIAEAGSREVGKRADLVILDGNPLAVPPEALLGLRVVTTLVAGARSGRRRGRRPELSRRRPL